MRITVLGASGFIGRHLTRALRARGDEVVEASARNIEAAAAACDGADVVVNLAGAPVAQRWTERAKAEIRSSRVDTTHALIERLRNLSKRPGAYICASAIGYYAPSEDATYVETSPPGDGFLARLCVEWERAASEAARYEMRVAVVRTGVVLGNDGGALGAMLPIFRLGLGGPVASGRQWFSWIHIEDQIGIYEHVIDGGTGAYNATAPAPVRNAEFTRELAAVLHRPAFFPVPTVALRLAFGEGAATLATGARVLPQRIQAEGYVFRYPNLRRALATIVPAQVP